MNKPRKYRRFILFVVDSWRVVMDNRYNPLRYIPDPSLQFYFTLVLFTMWSVYFGAVATYYMGWYGYNTVTSIIIHLAVLIPTGFTNAIFKDAERNGSKWHSEWRNEESAWKFWQRKTKPNVVKWDIDKEA
tara:strand:+ start:152 stop:544 length:393 start_codon:yes stop_codon:yes gene_type:complete